jgi:hypothetical protein
MSVTINPSAITEDKSLQTVSADLSKLDIAGNQVNLAVAELTKIKIIASKTEQDDAMALLKLCKEVENAIEKKRTELVKPFNDSVKKINTYAKDLTGKLSVAIEAVKTLVLGYQKEQQKIALQARTTARQAAITKLGFVFDEPMSLYKLAGIGSMTTNELQNYDDNAFNTILSAFAESVNRANEKKAAEVKQSTELDVLFGDDTHNIATADIQPVVVAPVNGYKTETVKGTTKRWVFDVIDINQIPREYLMVNETEIRNAINQGVRTIPGVNIYQKESLSIR